MTPAIPLWQWPGVPQKNQIGLVSLTVTWKTLPCVSSVLDLAQLIEKGLGGRLTLPSALLLMVPESKPELLI